LAAVAIQVAVARSVPVSASSKAGVKATCASATRGLHAQFLHAAVGQRLVQAQLDKIAMVHQRRQHHAGGQAQGRQRLGQCRHQRTHATGHAQGAAVQSAWGGGVGGRQRTIGGHTHGHGFRAAVGVVQVQHAAIVGLGEGGQAQVLHQPRDGRLVAGPEPGRAQVQRRAVLGLGGQHPAAQAMAGLEQAPIDALGLQAVGERKPAHAATDDGHVQHDGVSPTGRRAVRP